MFCDIGLQATTAKTSSYMICQSYWKMYHWQPEHEYGTCMMVLRHILAVLCETFSVTSIIFDEYAEEDPLHDLHACQIWILPALVYAAPVVNEGALHHLIVDACQVICNNPASLNGCGGPW
jgi:hypothetical protein